jgi:hypothetical protein
LALKLSREAQAEFIDAWSPYKEQQPGHGAIYPPGILTDDAELARRTAEMTYQAAWDELSESQKFRAMYRFL